jgi:hypothetical protein
VTTEFVRLRAWSFALGLLLCLPACGKTSTQATVYIDEKKIPDTMRSDYESFVGNCSKCHSLARAFNANVTDPAHWDMYVARMMRTAGSSISPAEKPHILRFLHWYTEKYVPAEKAAGADKEKFDDVVTEAPSASAPEKNAYRAPPEPAVRAPEAPPAPSAPSEAVVPAPEVQQATDAPATPPAEDQ